MLVGLFTITPTTTGILAGGSIAITECSKNGSTSLGVATRKKGIVERSGFSRAAIEAEPSIAAATHRLPRTASLPRYDT